MLMAGWYLGKSWKIGLALSLIVALAACGSSGSPSSVGEKSYLLTLKISNTDSQQALTQKYGGETVMWHPENGFAIFKMSQQAVSQFKSKGISMQGTLDPNSSTAAPEVTASGWNAWAGGWNAWAGGWNAWAGGWNAWAGGTSTIPTIPSENRNAWMRLGLPQAFAISKNFGAGMKVAVIDTGIDLNHPIFTGRLAPSSEWKDFVDGDTTPQEVSGAGAYGHGTAVAGLILQVAPKATILPIRVLNSNGTADVATIASAIDWAVQKNARIINLSLGTNVDVAALKTAIDYATSMAIYVVASAGNEGSTTNITYPAAYATTGTNAKYLISVGSAQESTTFSTFSNRGTALEVAAPGEGLYSAYPGNQIATVTGTSFAAPVVSGMLALGAYETAMSNTANLESQLINSTFTMTGGGKHAKLNYMRLQQPDFVRWRKALLVVGSTTLNSGDTAINNRLQWDLGYSVTLKTGAAATSADATGMDVVVVSSTVNPTDVNTKFKNVAVPVVTWESQLFDDMGMVTASASYYGTATGQTSVVINNNTHPLGAGILLGNTNIYGNAYASGVTMNWGKPTSSAINIASLVSDSTKSVVFAYDKGASMVGLTAPARRVAFMFSDTNTTTAEAKWWTVWLFESAITWAVSGN